MGYPDGGVVPVPTELPDLAALVEQIPLDPLGRRGELAAALRGATVTSEPGFGTGHLCVTSWVFDAGGRHVLLVRHRTLGWVQPGGHLDPGESPAVGAMRELQEETGLVLRPDGGSEVPAVLHPAVFPARGGHPAHRHWNLGYRYTASPDDPLVPEDDAPVAWFPVDDLPSPTTPDVAPIVLLLASGAG